MSHIRVDDEMYRRVMNAVSEALDEQEETSEEETRTEAAPVRRRAKISVMQIISIAAAAILVAGGALYFAARFFPGSKKAETANNIQAVHHADTAAAATDAEHETKIEVDAALPPGVNGARNSGDASKKTLTTGKTKVSTSKASEAKEDPSKEDIEESEGAKAPAETDEDRNKYTYDPAEPTYSAMTKRTFKDNLPFKVRSVGSSTFGEDKIKATVYAGENGEKMVLLSAREGTDIVKAYYPDFKGIPVLLQTEGGQQFKGIDISVGKKEQVSSSGPLDAVTWTKDGTSYMLVFNKKTDVSTFASIIEMI